MKTMCTTKHAAPSEQISLGDVFSILQQTASQILLKAQYVLHCKIPMLHSVHPEPLC